MGRRVLFLFIVCAVLPVTVLGVTSYRSAADALRRQASERARLTAKRMGSALFERLENLQYSLTFAATRIGEGAAGRVAEAAIIDERFAAVAVIARGSRRNVKGMLPSVPVLTPRQQRHLGSGGTVLTVSDSGGAILLVRRIAPDTSGMIWAQVSDAVVDRILTAESSTSAPGPSCIVLGDGTPIRCPGSEALRNGAFTPALGGEPTGAFPWRSDERYLSGFWSLFLDAEFASPDWRFVYSEPESEILAPLTEFRRTFALAALLAIVVVAFLSTGQIRRSLGPLAALRAGTERVARLEFDQPVDVKSGDEFEDLGHAFNSMSQGLRDQFIEGERLNKALTIASDDLREREAWLAAILNAAADAIITVDAAGRVASFNRTAETVFGHPEAEAVGKPLNDLFAVPLGTGLGSLPSSRPEVGSTMLQVGGIRRDGATFPAEVMFNEARAGDRTIYTVFVRDISKRKRAAEQRELLEEQLRQAQKMETIGTLAGGIAHDFNNILTPIIGHVDLALGDAPTGTLKEDLEEVRRAAMRAKDLVQQILLFSRRGEKNALRPIEVGPIVKEVLKFLRASLPSTIEIRPTIAADVPRILGDPTQLHQVLMNLCTNAYHAMRDRGGVLEVRLEAVERDAGAAAAMPRLQGDRAVRLTVSDSGVGMDTATLERLFEPFFTTKPAGEGTGLGMSIVHGIIADHGGTITVRSTKSVGTTFEMHFPPAGREADVAQAAVVSPMARGEGRILVVDDEVVIARIVTRVLERQGYAVVSTTTPLDVPGILASAEPPFDLVITDQTMPGLTGLELAERIATLCPGLPVIMMSGYSEFRGGRDPRELGLRELMVKPVELDVLASTVGRVLAEDRANRAAGVRLDGLHV